MAEDPLKQYQIKESGGGAPFTKLGKGSEIKIRVLTTDPLINVDRNYGSTRFAFVIYNLTEGRAEILNKGATILRPIQQIHQDEDLGADVTKLDIKIRANSTGPEDKDVEYTVQALPNSTELSQEQIDEAKQIDLESVITGGVRMSKSMQGEQPTKPDKQEEPPIESFQDDPDEDNIDLSDIPF